MYRPNLLQRNVLITPDEIIFHAPTKETINPRMLEQHIIIAEERFIRPALGYEFYWALCDAKNRTITSSNKAATQTLINNSLGEDAQSITLAIGDIVNASEFLSSDNLELWKQHLWKLTAECVMLLALPEGYVQYGAVGTHMNQPPAGPIPNSTDIVSPDLPSLKFAMNKKLQDRIDPLREALHQWLCVKQKADSSKYTLYTKACDCDENGVAYKRKTDIVLGAYDEDDDDCCRSSGWGFPQS